MKSVLSHIMGHASCRRKEKKKKSGKKTSEVKRKFWRCRCTLKFAYSDESLRFPLLSFLLRNFLRLPQVQPVFFCYVLSSFNNESLLLSQKNDSLACAIISVLSWSQTVDSTSTFPARLPADQTRPLHCGHVRYQARTHVSLSHVQTRESRSG